MRGTWKCWVDYTMSTRMVKNLKHFEKGVVVQFEFDGP